MFPCFEKAAFSYPYVKERSGVTDTGTVPGVAYFFVSVAFVFLSTTGVRGLFMLSNFRDAGG